MKKSILLLSIILFLVACQKVQQPVETLDDQQSEVLPETIPAELIKEPEPVFNIIKGSNSCGDYYEDNFDHKFYLTPLRNSNCDGRIYAKLIEEKLFRTMNTGIARIILNPEDLEKAIGKPRRYKAILDDIEIKNNTLIVTANANNNFVKTKFPSKDYQICDYNNKEFTEFVTEKQYDLPEDLPHLITKIDLKDLQAKTLKNLETNEMFRQYDCILFEGYVEDFKEELIIKGKEMTSLS